jgi:8-oxo-dGTP pyrophosphatase MutT (NUDIX family)
MRSRLKLTEVSAARPSSTVVLARRADGNPELLLVRRHEKSSFGGAYAFPGGVLEGSDSTAGDYCAGITDNEARALLGVDEALAYLSAAIRELFEESGVLLATIEDDACDLASARDQLNSGELQWNDFLAQSGASLHCDALHYFSFWITPEIFKARYSTRFFLAAMTDSRWISASVALHAAKNGDLPMHFPTIKTLESLAGFGTIEEMIDWARTCAAEGVPCIFPHIGERDGERHVIVDGRDAGALK